MGEDVGQMEVIRSVSITLELSSIRTKYRDGDQLFPGFPIYTGPADGVDLLSIRFAVTGARRRPRHITGFPLSEKEADEILTEIEEKLPDKFFELAEEIVDRRMRGRRPGPRNHPGIFLDQIRKARESLAGKSDARKQEKIAERMGISPRRLQQKVKYFNLTWEQALSMTEAKEIIN